MPKPLEDDQDLIQSTVAGLEARVAELRRKKARHAERYDEQIEKVLQLIEQWKVRLEALPTTSVAKLKGTRRKRGENLRVVQECLIDRVGGPATISEIAEWTKLPRTSVRVIMDRYGGSVFVKDDKDRWSLAPRQAVVRSLAPVIGVAG